MKVVYTTGESTKEVKQVLELYCTTINEDDDTCYGAIVIRETMEGGTREVSIDSDMLIDILITPLSEKETTSSMVGDSTLTTTTYPTGRSKVAIAQNDDLQLHILVTSNWGAPIMHYICEPAMLCTVNSDNLITRNGFHEAQRLAAIGDILNPQTSYGYISPKSWDEFIGGQLDFNGDLQTILVDYGTDITDEIAEAIRNVQDEFDKIREITELVNTLNP